MLAWADVRIGYQHDVISHALATIERLGDESGRLRHVHSHRLAAHHQAAGPVQDRHRDRDGRAVSRPQPDLLRRHLLLRRARDRPDARTAGRPAVLRASEDGKGFVAAHSAATAFFSWPEFGEMLGGRFDEHPWNITDATVVVEDPAFPAMKGFPAVDDVVRRALPAEGLLARQAPRPRPARPERARSEGAARPPDGRRFPVAWAKTYGKGRVFYSTLGHLRGGVGHAGVQTDVLRSHSMDTRADGRRCESACR